jgi:hypothetical protein
MPDNSNNFEVSKTQVAMMASMLQRKVISHSGVRSPSLSFWPLLAPYKVYGEDQSKAMQKRFVYLQACLETSRNGSNSGTMSETA